MAKAGDRLLRDLMVHYWFGCNKIVSNISIKIDKIAINQETSTKFLGVIIYQSLSWNDHISIVKQKVSKSIGIIKHIR